MGAQQADVDALSAAMGAVVIAIHVDHGIEARFAGNGAALAGVNAFFIAFHDSELLGVKKVA